MANWRKTVELADLWRDEIPDPMDDVDGFNRIKTETIRRLEESNVFPAHLITLINSCKSLAGFRIALNGVYDYADANLIWMGL